MRRVGAEPHYFPLTLNADTAKRVDGIGVLAISAILQKPIHSLGFRGSVDTIRNWPGRQCAPAKGGSSAVRLWAGGSLLLWSQAPVEPVGRNRAHFGFIGIKYRPSSAIGREFDGDARELRRESNQRRSENIDSNLFLVKCLRSALAAYFCQGGGLLTRVRGRRKQL